MTLYQRLLLLAVLPVALLSLLVFGTFHVTSDQEADGVLINLAGRQRMLTQKMTKEVLLLEGARLSGDTQRVGELEEGLRVTKTIFGETLEALFRGGLAPSGLNVSKGAPRVSLEASKGEIREQLKKVSSMWSDFAPRIDSVIKGDSYESDLTAISSGNIPLLQEMNKAVVMLQRSSESKVALLRWIQGLGIFVGLGIAFRSILISRKINQELVGSIIKLNDGAEIVSRSSKVFSGISDDLADGASVQAAGVEETSAAITEINQKMQDCVDTVHKASEEALKAESSSEIAETSMAQMQEAFSNLESSINEVVGVIKSIEEIAFQTNILALNAAVEAARAGEAGAGFAVVADEVRSLAQRASNAANESHGLIEKNHTYTNEGRAIIERASAAMDDLFGLSKSMCGYMSDTDELMQGNGEAVRQVEVTIASIDKSIQDMAAGTQQASANSHDLENEVSRLYSVVQGLSRITTIRSEGVREGL